MNNGKYAKRRGGVATKTLIVALAVMLVIGCAVGGTLAWLTDTTNQVTNTFTVGNIDISLAETKTDFKMVPGATIDKDPKVTVKARSEACWLFVKVTESDNLDSFISYTIASGWTELTGVAGVSGVYYREVADLSTSTTDEVYSVLANDQVTVNENVTKDMMDAITAGTAANPTLTFKAYAVQRAGVATAAEAWAKVPA